MSEYTEIKKVWENGNIDIDDIDVLFDIIKKKDEAINDLLINIELSHPEEYKQYRELAAVDEAYKLTEE